MKTLSLLVAVPALAFALIAASPSPKPAPTPSPAPSAADLPYPAYGTPAPDVASLRPVANVPTQITLEQAVAIAAAQSPTFASERAQYDAIRAKYGAAKGALFPSVSADGSVTRDYGGNAGGSGGGGTGGNNTTFSLEGRISQLIFDGGRVLAGLREAKEDNFAGKLTLDRALQTLNFDVATAYFQVLQSEASVDAASQSVRQFQVTEDSINAEIHAGAAAKSDISQASYQTAKARGLLVTAQGQEIAAQSAFAALLGLDADTEVVPVARSTSGLPAQAPTYAKSLAQAFLLRGDYLASVHDVNSAKAGVQYARLARIPSIQATYSDGVSKTLPQTSFSNSGSLGATISIPIFDQNQTNYAIAVAQSNLDQADAALILTKLGVEQQVRSALAGVISSRASLVQAQLELDAAKVGLASAQARYKVGVATILDLVTAEASYSQAQTDYVNAVYAAQTSEQNYDYAVGSTGIAPAP